MAQTTATELTFSLLKKGIIKIDGASSDVTKRWASARSTELNKKFKKDGVRAVSLKAPVIMKEIKEEVVKVISNNLKERDQIASDVTKELINFFIQGGGPVLAIIEDDYSGVVFMSILVGKLVSDQMEKK